MRRFFILDDRLHPVWRAAVYLAGLLSGLVGLNVLLAVAWIVGLLFLGADFNRLSAQIPGITNSPLFLLSSSALNLGWSLLLAAVCLRWLDGAPFTSLGFARAGLGRETLWGLAAGGASMAITFGTFLSLGWARVEGFAGPPGLLESLGLLTALVAAAAFEEVVFRGYLVRTLLGWRGWGVPLVATSVLFGLAHLGNPNVSGLALFNIALAGAAFALALRLTGRLWLPIAYHFAWNFAQGPLLGMSVSGLDFPTLLRTQLTGPALWTGGAFGPEGGLAVTFLLLASLGVLLALNRRRARAPAPLAPSAQ